MIVVIGLDRVRLELRLCAAHYPRGALFGSGLYHSVALGFADVPSCTVEGEARPVKSSGRMKISEFALRLRYALMRIELAEKGRASMRRNQKRRVA